MKNIILCITLGILAVSMFAVVLFPVIIAFATGNFFLIFLYFVWWLPASFILASLGALVKVLFELW